MQWSGFQSPRDCISRHNSGVLLLYPDKPPRPEGTARTLPCLQVLDLPTQLHDGMADQRVLALLVGSGAAARLAALPNSPAARALLRTMAPSIYTWRADVAAGAGPASVQRWSSAIRRCHAVRVAQWDPVICDWW